MDVTGCEKSGSPIRLTLYSTVLLERHFELRLRYVDLVCSIEVAVAVCCCFTAFSC
jgi:hypothetical protein